VDDDGRVYVVTNEGVVHALDVDGVFRWSYTLTGFASHPPSVGPRGRVYVATNERRIYALTPEGRRWWTFRSPVAVETHVGVGDRGVLYFGGSDEHLWALSSRAGALWRAKMDGPISVGPVMSGNRKTAAVGSTSGLLSFFRGAHWRKNVRLAATPMSQLEFVDERSVLVRAGGQLVLIADGEVVWRRPDISSAASGPDGSIVAITNGWEVLAVSGRGAVERRATLPGEPSSRLVHAGDKLVVGSAGGKLWVVETNGAIRDIAVTHGAIAAVVADTQRGRVVVTSGDGTVAAVRVTN
jgi:outer membrane protein assembly factor BamB